MIVVYLHNQSMHPSIIVQIVPKLQSFFFLHNAKKAHFLHPISLNFCLLQEKKRKIEIKKVKEGKGKSSCCTLIIIIIIIIIINFFILATLRNSRF